MAKKEISGYVKLQIKGGQANPAPPVGPALGQHGVNIMEFCKAFNAATEEVERGLITPVVITVYQDRSFTFEMKTPPAAVLIRKEAGIKKGSGEPNKTKVGKITVEQVRKIAEIKMADLNATDPSTGATVGNNRFDPDEDGALAALPSKFKVTNKEGLQRPVPSSHSSASLAGAPNNDLLDLEAARKLALNTQKIQFAGYLNRIRRLVNFYWSQNVKNMPNSARATLRPESCWTAHRWPR